MPYNVNFGNIQLVNHCCHIGVNGKTYIVIHGDLFDGLLRTNFQWLYHFGDVLYDLLLKVNHFVSKVRNWLGLPHWSLSKYLKDKTKEAVSYVNNFEDLIADYCRKQKADGIICGHIHKAEIKMINGIEYMNDGDWVESMSALVEHHDGTWEIIYWLQEREK